MHDLQIFDGAKVYTTHLGDKEISIETGVLAQQSGGSVTVRCGDTVIMATATMAKDVRPGIDFFPLTVDFEEKMYAVGRIPGSFFRREGRPSEQGILLCRLVDRPLRPLFPKGFRNDVQLILHALSSDAASENGGRSAGSPAQHRRITCTNPGCSRSTEAGILGRTPHCSARCSDAKS